MSFGVGRFSSPSVFLFVCPQRNSKIKVNSNLVQGMTLGYHGSGIVLGLTGQRSTLGLGLTIHALSTSLIHVNSPVFRHPHGNPTGNHENP